MEKACPDCLGKIVEKTFEGVHFQQSCRLEACCSTKNELNCSILLGISATHFSQNTFEQLLLGIILQLALSYRVTPKLSYTFGPDSITFDTKRVVKINQDVTMTSATKLKMHKIRNELIQTYFETKFQIANRYQKNFGIQFHFAFQNLRLLKLLV